MTLIANVAARPLSQSRTETIRVAFVALFLGLGLVFVAGFANPESVHDAAHDSRHALSFPCH